MTKMTEIDVQMCHNYNMIKHKLFKGREKWNRNSKEAVSFFFDEQHHNSIKAGANYERSLNFQNCY